MGYEQLHARKYYIEYCPYGRSTISDGDTLYAFASNDDRASWLINNWRYYNELTAAEARSRYGVTAMRMANIPGAPIYQTHLIDRLRRRN